jgi:hypothetical protein
LTDTTKGHYTDKISVLGIQNQKRVLRIPINKLVAFQGRADTSKKSLDDLLTSSTGGRQ